MFMMKSHQLISRHCSLYGKVVACVNMLKSTKKNQGNHLICFHAVPAGMVFFAETTNMALKV